MAERTLKQDAVDGVRECYESFYSKGIGGIECSFCPYHPLCKRWSTGDGITAINYVFKITEEADDAEKT